MFSTPNRFIAINVECIQYAKWIPSRNLAVIKFIDGSTEWLDNFEDFETLHKSFNQSNHLNTTAKIQPRVTTRRGKQHERNYHKSAQIPQPHVYVGNSPDTHNCFKCELPFNHPCHNASNPIEENKSDANQPEATRTDGRDTDVTK